MANTKRGTRNTYRNEVGISRIVFFVALTLIGLASFGSSVVFKTRETSRQNEIEKLQREMADLRDEIKSQRTQQAALLNHTALKKRLAEMNSMLVEIPAGDVFYIDRVPTNPALRANPTGLASTADMTRP